MRERLSFNGIKHSLIRNFTADLFTLYLWQLNCICLDFLADMIISIGKQTNHKQHQVKEIVSLLHNLPCTHFISANSSTACIQFLSFHFPWFACRCDGKNRQANQVQVRDCHRSLCSITEFAKVITDLHPASVAVPMLPQETYCSGSSTSTNDQRHHCLLITIKIPQRLHQIKTNILRTRSYKMLQKRGRKTKYTKSWRNKKK